MTRKAWRQWLQENHTSSPGIWMIYYKKGSEKRRFDYGEAVEEALCFGWIDSLPRKLDEARSMLKFTPRKAKSPWSQLNKKRINRLIAAGLMVETGLAKIEKAKKDGSWEKSTSTDSHIDGNTLPDDLLKAFGKNKKALANFKSFAPGYRKRFLFWIDCAKHPETKYARIQQTVMMAKANKKPGVQGFKL